MQDLLSYAVVAVAAGWLGMHAFRATLGRPVARWLIRRGNTKLAMLLRPVESGSTCGSCPACPTTAAAKKQA